MQENWIGRSEGVSFKMDFCDEDKKKLKEALADYQELPFVIDKYGSRIVLNLEGLSW